MSAGKTGKVHGLVNGLPCFLGCGQHGQAHFVAAKIYPGTGIFDRCGGGFDEQGFVKGGHPVAQGFGFFQMPFLPGFLHLGAEGGGDI